MAKFRSPLEILEDQINQNIAMINFLQADMNERTREFNKVITNNIAKQEKLRDHIRQLESDIHFIKKQAS
jgi:FtsZ-binding cell division protein ZapB